MTTTVRAAVSNRDQANLLQLLDALSFSPAPGTTAIRPYSIIRPLFCEINLHLNTLGKVAPRFRPLRRSKPRNAPTFSDDDKLLSNDRQVIDLHWLHARKARFEYGNRRWEGLTKIGIFDFQLAGSFVTTVGTVQAKVEEALKLPEKWQWHLATLQTKKLAERWRSIEERATQDVWPALEGLAEERPARETVIDSWLRMWKCAVLMGPAMRPKTLLQLVNVAGLNETDASNVMKKLSKVYDALDP